MSGIISELVSRDTIYIQSQQDRSSAVYFSVTGAPTDGAVGTYWKIPVSYISGGTALVSGEGCMFNIGKSFDHTLASHTDVTITTPSSTQVLTYNGSVWVNSAPSGGTSYWTYTGASLYNLYADDAGNGASMTGAYNFLAGYEAGSTLTGGYRNIFIGYQAGDGTTTAYQNIALGYLALSGAQLTGVAGNNVAIGTGALNAFEGYQSVAIGTYAATSIVGNNTIGHIAIGGYDLRYNVGAGNLAIGYAAGQGTVSVSDSDYGIFIGYEAGNDVTTGNNNTFIGYRSGYSTQDGQNNTGLGG